MRRNRYIPTRQNFWGKPKPDNWFRYKTYAEDAVADRIGKHNIAGLISQGSLPRNWIDVYEIWIPDNPSMGDFAGTIDEDKIGEMEASLQVVNPYAERRHYRRNSKRQRRYDLLKARGAGKFTYTEGVDPFTQQPHYIVERDQIPFKTFYDEDNAMDFLSSRRDEMEGRHYRRYHNPLPANIEDHTARVIEVVADYYGTPAALEKAFSKYYKAHVKQLEQKKKNYPQYNVWLKGPPALSKRFFWTVYKEIMDEKAKQGQLTDVRDLVIIGIAAHPYMYRSEGRGKDKTFYVRDAMVRAARKGKKRYDVRGTKYPLTDVEREALTGMTSQEVGDWITLFFGGPYGKWAQSDTLQKRASDWFDASSLKSWDSYEIGAGKKKKTKKKVVGGSAKPKTRTRKSPTTQTQTQTKTTPKTPREWVAALEAAGDGQSIGVAMQLMGYMKDRPQMATALCELLAMQQKKQQKG